VGISPIGGDLDDGGDAVVQALPSLRRTTVPGEGVDGESSQVGELVELVSGHGEQRIVGGAHAVCPLTDDLGGV
jgi:hypothetical protein